MLYCASHQFGGMSSPRRCWLLAASPHRRKSCTSRAAASSQQPANLVEDMICDQLASNDVHEPLGNWKHTRICRHSSESEAATKMKLTTPHTTTFVEGECCQSTPCSSCVEAVVTYRSDMSEILRYCDSSWHSTRIWAAQSDFAQWQTCP